LHWLVALLTSFSGLFFLRARADTHDPARTGVAAVVVFAGLLLGTAAAVGLGRSYDFIPALRSLHTGGVYGTVRHPMYLASIVTRLGYVIENARPVNALLLGILAWLYDRRARYEEAILHYDPGYREYCQRVPCRFVYGWY
jgi:protein-S-isoprenylcysteine O-methyltransferase Ste14